ncbi:D-alanine--D-alanine ligase family protein [Tropheryma whipplei]|uniref:D-alanine--D-alanine ligase family protein n=1 Tax=Tropheryma whipplei TaxID=2039 RepID=UPI0004B98373|nr:D-alanine--D-alanine ligase family protein [Tropheryma whipplei]
MRRLLLLFGGRSQEHSVSYASARALLEHICDEWTVIPVGITKHGDFVYCSTVSEQDYGEVIDNGNRVVWPSRAGCKKIEVVQARGKSFFVEFDLVFPLLHGVFGEDGTIQGMLDLLDIPYVGSGVFASAAAMDKHYTKILCSHAGIPVLPWYLIKGHAWHKNRDSFLKQISDRFTFPLFVKPVDAGSSFGCTFVDFFEQLPVAIEHALRHGKSAIVEPALDAPEVFCSLIENNGVLQCSELVYVKHSGSKFYDYSAKYLNPVEFVIPAQFDNTDGYAEIASKVFFELGCRHYARIDFFVTESGLVLNEINTSPGLTQKSIFPSSFKSMQYSQVIETILASAYCQVTR